MPSPPSGPTKDNRFVASCSPFSRTLRTVVFSWWAISLLSALTGILPLRSLAEVFKTIVFLFMPFMVATSFQAAALGRSDTLRRLETYFLYFLLGQSFAALHTILTDGLNISVPIGIPGAVTESGQLVMMLAIVMASAFIIFSIPSLRSSLSFQVFRWSIPPASYAVYLFIALLIVCWPGALTSAERPERIIVVRLAALSAALLLFLPPILRGLPILRNKLNSMEIPLSLELYQLTWPAAALLFSALIINLKRGPWFGVFVELAVIGILFSRRFLLSATVLLALVLISFAPARTRLLNLHEHFAISGGRQMMWELGAELGQRFPLGLGTNNARYMQQLDPLIPGTHRHMHNNFLNIVVETGWIGLAVYLWWMYVVISVGFVLWRRTRSERDRFLRQLGIIALFLSVGLLGWQVAGLVEYNFGDGEVRMMAFFFMGLLLAIDASAKLLPYGAKESIHRDIHE